MSEEKPAPTPEPVDRSEAALAASAHSRINIPLNLDNWRNLPKPLQDDLCWYHQHVLDARMTLDEAAEALGYDRSVVWRALKGVYEGSWANISKAIVSYRRTASIRGTIQQNVYVANGIARLIAGGLDYALANESVTTIVGESRMGKSVGVCMWRDENNHGLSVLVIAPPYGGTKMLLREIAAAVGVNRNLSVPNMYEAIARSFNRHRILLVDEAHRLLPGDRRTNPTNIEILRDLHDRTGCALALVATQRFDDELRKSHYQFEQLLGRIGMPVRLPRRLKETDVRPIVDQYIRRPSLKLMQLAMDIANAPGRLGILVEVLKVASRIAHKAGQPLAEEHVHKAVALRRQMMGETQYAK